MFVVTSYDVYGNYLTSDQLTMRDVLDIIQPLGIEVSVVDLIRVKRGGVLALNHSGGSDGSLPIIIDVTYISS